MDNTLKRSPLSTPSPKIRSLLLPSSEMRSPKLTPLPKVRSLI
ncbi:hypothetical protein [Fischerella sp. JS2]|nr:hypothetical protein [Fischerella sp. JS2]